MTSKLLAILHALLAGAQVIAGAAALADLVGTRTAAWWVLGVAAGQAALGTYHARTATTPVDTIRASMS